MTERPNNNRIESSHLLNISDKEKYGRVFSEDYYIIVKYDSKPLKRYQSSHSVVSNSLRPHESQHVRLPCPSPAPRAYSNSCPSCRCCHLTISSSVVPFSFHLKSFPASGSFPISRFFASGGHSIGVSTSASVLPMNIQD